MSCPLQQTLLLFCIRTSAISYRAKGARDLTHFSPFIFLINSLIHSLIYFCCVFPFMVLEDFCFD